MNPVDRTKLLTQSHTTIDWLTTEPHTLERAIAVLHDTARTRATNPPPSSSGTTSYAGGGHSDPTAGAVGAISTAEAQARRRTNAIDNRLTTRIHPAATGLDRAASTALGRTLPTTNPTGRQLILADTALHLERLTTRPHDLNAAIERLPRADAERLDLALDTLSRDIAWLGTETFGLLKGAVIDPPEPIQQPKITGCRVHARYLNPPAQIPPATPGRTLCAQCQTFQDRHRCLPTEAIIRRWDYGYPATPGQILEAKAATRAAPRKTA